MDFTLNTYKLLLSASLTSGYSFQTYFEFVQDTKEKAIIMRHDVDRLSANALQMARLEYEMGIGSTYYFRVVSQSWNESIIREIADLGHEIGYHYEDLSMCKGDMERAIML
jgi:3-dehydroquinate synthetase